MGVDELQEPPRNDRVAHILCHSPAPSPQNLHHERVQRGSGESVVWVVVGDSETRGEKEEAKERQAEVEGDGGDEEGVEKLEEVAAEAEPEEGRHCCC